VLLTVLAARLQAHFRSADTVDRLGGDEFVVLCAEGPGESGCLSRRLADVWEEPVPLPGGAPGVEPVLVRVRGTVGTATARAGESDAADLLARADADMYRRKRLRRE
jgi:diguanylate cyclase (GGDEF)-like protein